MPTSASPAPRDVWWVRCDKKRLCIVLRVEADRAQVVSGRGAPGHGVPLHAVTLGSPDGRRLGVRKDTHFRADGALLVRLERFEHYVCRCPATLFDRVQSMIAEHVDELGRYTSDY